MIAGIICEYNPFHLGHRKQFLQIRERFGSDTQIVCLMSGNFVQRAEPALFDKSIRAKAAVLCGADLVLELGVTCAVASAEGFASGAVAALRQLGLIDVLCFGSETGELEPLWSAAQALNTTAFSQKLREYLDRHISFAAARQQALAALGADADCLRRPNDILAVEYCKALQKQNAAIQPAAFARAGDYHAAEPDADDPSAASIRALFPDGDWAAYVPPKLVELYRQAQPHRLEYGERAMLAVLRSLPTDWFERMPYGAEGLWRKFARACRTQPSLEALIAAVKSKRYAYSRIARMCLCSFLQIDAQTVASPAPYLRALACGQAGRALLTRLRAAAQVPIYNAGARVDDPYYALEERCSTLYALFSRELPQHIQEKDRKLIV